MATDLQRFTSTVAGVLLHCWTQPSWKVIQRNVTADNGKARAFILCKHKHEWICSNASTSLKNPMPVEHGRRKNFLQGGQKWWNLFLRTRNQEHNHFFLKCSKSRWGKVPPGSLPTPMSVNVTMCLSVKLHLRRLLFHAVWNYAAC